MLIAHISDLHIRPPGQPAHRVSDTYALSARALQAVAALDPRPDLLLISGDLADRGLPEEYAHLRALLAGLGLPVLMLPGNHDVRAAMIAGLDLGPHARTGDGFVQFLADLGGLRLIGLDTLVSGQSAGALCETRLAFLEEALATAGHRPVVIAMHHPPFDSGIAHMDRIRLSEGAERFRAIVGRHAGIERILCGHHHRPIQARFAGTMAQIAPSVSHQVTLDLAPDALATIQMEPPAYHLHSYRPQTGLVTHTAYVERFPGPFSFVRAAEAT